MISNIKIIKKEVELISPFKYFLDTLPSLPYAQVQVYTTDKIIGKGEIACSLDADGETSDSAVGLQYKLAAMLKGFEIKSKSDIEKILNFCELNICFNKATKCGLEQALFDILSQQQDKPMAKILKIKYHPQKIQCTISFLDNEESYKEKINQVATLNPKFIKFKVGINLKLEAKIINYCKNVLPEVSISADANQAFKTAKDALNFLKNLSKGTLTWIEQPLPREDFKEWQKLKSQSQIPLMADESIHTAREALWYLENNLVDFINIKLAKCGGIIEAEKIITLAEKFNIPVMLGSMLHGELGLTYNLLFGLSQPFITYDFYSYFLLKDTKKPYLIDEKTLIINESIMTKSWKGL
jgi:L-alanine-DL-glutamate epimerase-like enolase superfamily enzyme